MYLCTVSRGRAYCITRSLSSRLHHKYSTSSNISLDDIRQQFTQFKGGDVTLDYAGHNQDIAVIKLSNPERMNALTGSMCISLYDIIKHLSTDNKSKAVIVHGSQGHFCAGADLSMAKKIADSANGERFSHLMQTVLCNLRSLPLPSYAALQGNVMGAGAEICVACDFAIASPHTNIQFVQGRMGIVPGLAGSVHLVSKVGYHKALHVLLAEKSMNTDYAHSIGLVDYTMAPSSGHTESLSDDQLVERSLEVIERRLRDLPAHVIRGLKSVAINSTSLSYTDAVTHERQVFKSLWGAEANLKAFSLNIKHTRK